MNVLVPGSAGPAGINVIKSLKMAKFDGKIIATDSNDLAAGFYLADSHYVMPEVSKREYVDRLFQVVRQEKINVLMPSSGYDIIPYSDNEPVLRDMGAVPVVSSGETLRICQDKIRTIEFLAKDPEVRSYLPFTTDSKYNVKAFPVVAKPRYEKGGSEFLVINDEGELAGHSSILDKMILQEYLPGTEYTVDVLSDMRGNALIAVPRIRLETKSGISVKGKVIHNKELENVCKRIATLLQIKGPSCIQMKKSAGGTEKVVEVNARMGGGTIFAAYAGVNFPALILEMVQNGGITVPQFEEITVIRYYDEIIVRSGANTTKSF